MRLLLPLALFLGVVFSAPAAAQSGVVLSFSGRGSGQARNAAVREATQRFELVDRRDAERTATRLGADLNTPEGRAQLAEDMGLTVMITGAVQGRGRRARTTVVVFDQRGEEVARQETGAPIGRRGRTLVQRATGQALDEAMAAIEEQRAREEREAAAAREAEQRRSAWDAEAEPVEEEEEEEEESDALASMPLVLVLAGLEFRTRAASVDFAALGGRVYEASLHPELGLRLESFPLARSGSAARGLYLEAEFTVAIGLKSVELAMDGTEREIGTNAWRFLVQAGYQYAVNDDAFRVGALIGYGIDSFSLDANDTMPSSSYSQLRLGLVLGARLYEDLVRARVDAGYRKVFGVGDLAPEFGADASASGFDLGVSILGFHSSGASYAVRFGVTRYSLDFTGDANSAEAAGASEVTGSDRSLSLVVQGGYAF